MRITHYLQRISLEDGGVVRAVLDMAALQARTGHDVTVLTCDDSDAPEDWNDSVELTPNVAKIDNPSRPLALFSGSQLDAIKPIVRDSDVLHLHACWTTSNNQLGSMARKLGVPYVLSLHGMLDDWCMAQKSPKKKLYLALGGRTTLEQAAFVHATAQAELDQSKKWFPNGTGRVVPLIVDLEPYRELPGPDLANRAFPSIEPSDPLVLFLSRIHHKKGVDVFIKTAKVLADRGTPAVFCLAGTGDDAYVTQMKDLAKSVGVSDHVRFLGMVKGDTKLSLYQRADVFALPTSQENFGLVFPEALACETPVITTKGVDIWPELEAGGGAIIAEQNENAFADAIESLLNDEPKRTTMGQAGRAWVFDHLDPDRIARLFDEMYADCVANPKQGKRS